MKKQFDERTNLVRIGQVYIILIQIEQIKVQDEELLICNTYLNSLQQKPMENPAIQNESRKLKWADERKDPLVTIIPQHKNDDIKSNNRI